MNKHSVSVKTFAERRAKELESLGRNITAGHYRQCASRWVADMADKPFNRITKVDLDNWIERMKAAGLTPNSIDYYFRTLRALFNRALFEEEFKDINQPFASVHTSPEPTKKRALTRDQLLKLMNLKLKDWNSEWARMMFLLSFYLRGMAPVDMYCLKKSNLNGDFISYRRSKTRQALHIKVEREAKDIIDHFKSSDPDLLLDLPNKGTVNKHLRKIGDELKLPFHLTLYCARHTWATMAQRANVPLAVISKGLGHSNELTTQIYLAGIETPVIDNWNHKIINSLR